MSQPAKPAKGPRSGANARSGPSGRSTPRAQRTRRPVEVTLSAEAIAALDAEVARTEEPRSRLVETLILTGRPERYLAPALLEDLSAYAQSRGRSVWDCLHDAVVLYLHTPDEPLADAQRLAAREAQDRGWRVGPGDEARCPRCRRRA